MIGEYDLRNGLNFWGSAGVCCGCEHQRDCYYSNQYIRNWDQIMSGGYMFEKCPIKNFEIIDKTLLYSDQLKGGC